MTSLQTSAAGQNTLAAKPRRPAKNAELDAPARPRFGTILVPDCGWPTDTDVPVKAAKTAKKR